MKFLRVFALMPVMIAIICREMPRRNDPSPLNGLMSIRSGQSGPEFGLRWLHLLAMISGALCGPKSSAERNKEIVDAVSV